MLAVLVLGSHSFGVKNCVLRDSFQYRSNYSRNRDIIWNHENFTKLEHNWDHEFWYIRRVARVEEENSKVTNEVLCRKKKLSWSAILGMNVKAHSLVIKGLEVKKIRKSAIGIESYSIFIFIIPLVPRTIYCSQ